MENPFENILDLLVSILIIFLFPMIFINQHKDILVQTQVNDNINSFVENVAANGYLSKNMYEDFNKKIKIFLPDSEIVLEHEKRVFYPDKKKLAQASTYNYDLAVGDADTGISYEIFINTNTNEILKKIYTNEEAYYMKQGDYFKVKVSKDEIFKVYTYRTMIRGGY